MASNINYEDIDESFPKTGVDNPSQGFRDNFSVIKDSLQTTKEEISTLQSTTAKLNDENDFNGNIIKQAKLVNCVQESFTRTTPSTADQIVDFINGNYQEFRLDKNTNFILQGWPQSDGYVSLRIALFSTTDISHIATFRINGAGTISYDQETTYTEVGQSNGQSVQVVVRGMSSSQLIGSDIKVYEFWTKTSGSLVYARYLGIYNPSAPSSTGNSALSTTSLLVAGTADVAGTMTLSRSTGTSLDVKGNSVFEKDVVIAGNLTITGDLNKTIATATIADLGAIGDVTITNPNQGDTLRYDSTLDIWSNQATANVVNFNLESGDNGAGGVPAQFVLYLDGDPLVDYEGNQTTVIFKKDTTYRFNRGSLVDGLVFGFSTTPDNGAITPYTTLVTNVGISGNPGSYTEIVITEDTPSPLYFYATAPDEDNVLGPDFTTILWGAAYPISVNNGPVRVINKRYDSVGNQIIYVDTSVNNEPITIKLPAQSITTPGMFVTVVDSGSASVNNIIVDRNGSTINGETENKSINIDYYSVTLVTDGKGRWSINDPFNDGGTVLKTTNSTSTTTGALQVRGGVGIFGNMNLGGDLNVGAVSSFTAKTTSTTTDSNKIFDINDPDNTFLRSIVDNLDDTWRPSLGIAIPADGVIIVGGASVNYRIRIRAVNRNNNLVTISFKNDVTEEDYSFSTSPGNNVITFTRSNTGNLSITGKTNLSAEEHRNQDPFNISKSAAYSNSGTSATASLPAGEDGQLFIIGLTGSGPLLVNVTNSAWNNGAEGLMVFDRPGQSATMMYMGNRWLCVGNNGCRFGVPGNSAAATTGNSIDDLINVQLVGPVTVGQVLKWTGTNWTNGVDSGSTLNSLTDVNITNLQNNEVLKWNGISWVNNADQV